MYVLLLLILGTFHAIIPYIGMSRLSSVQFYFACNPLKNKQFSRSDLSPTLFLTEKGEKIKLHSPPEAILNIVFFEIYVLKSVFQTVLFSEK